MTRQNLYRNFAARAFIPTNNFAHLIEYLVTHPQLFIDELETAQLLSTRTTLTSTLTKIFHRLLSDDKLSMYSFIRVRPKEDHPPELLSLRQIPLDMKQAEETLTPALAGALMAQPSLHNKILLNVTPYILSTGVLTDSIGFQSAIVRDALSRSYVSDNWGSENAPNLRSAWISPNFTQFISKVYSITMSSAVSQWYRLDGKTTVTLTFLFALFYLNLIMGPDATKGILQSQWKKFLIPSPEDQKQIYGLVEETLGRYYPETLEEVFSVIDALGIPRLRVDRKLFANKMRTVYSSDVMTTLMVLDYPPALANLIIQTFSGTHVPLAFTMKRLGLDRNKMDVEEDILRSSSFFDSLG